MTPTQLTSDSVRRAITTVYSGIDLSSIHGRCRLARIDPAASVLLLSSQQTGTDRGSREMAAVNAARAKLGTYEVLEKELTFGLEGTWAIKGTAIARRYPPGWTRRTGDIDLVTTHEDSLLLADRLYRAGFKPTRFTIMGSNSELNLLVGLVRGRHPSGHVVEVSTVALLGRLGVLPPRHIRHSRDAPYAARHILGVLEERFERSFRPRDLIDVTVLLAGLDSGELRRIWKAVDWYQLWPEYSELVRLAVRACLLPASALPSSMCALSSRASRSRYQRVLQSWRQPNRALALTLAAVASQSDAWHARVASALIRRSVTVACAGRWGLPIHGAWLGDQNRSPLAIDYALTPPVAATPFGAFALGASDVVDL